MQTFGMDFDVSGSSQELYGIILAHHAQRPWSKPSGMAFPRTQVVNHGAWSLPSSRFGHLSYTAAFPS